MTSIKEIQRVIKITEGVISLDAPLANGDYDKLDDFESVLPIYEDTFDRYGWEQLFHTLTKQELELMICLFLQMPTDDIIKLMGYKSINRFYHECSMLKKKYREQKSTCLGYN